MLEPNKTKNQENRKDIVWNNSKQLKYLGHEAKCVTLTNCLIKARQVIQQSEPSKKLQSRVCGKRLNLIATNGKQLFK